MQITNEAISTVFKGKALRVTPQRMAVYKFLMLNPIHPSADEVYMAVLKDNPSLSRTTIYNVLNSLVENGLAITVKIDENEIRYDGNPQYHGHFRCSSCKKIYDFNPQEVFYEKLQGFTILQQDVYFSGICAECGLKKS